MTVRGPLCELFYSPKLNQRGRNHGRAGSLESSGKIPEAGRFGCPAAPRRNGSAARTHAPRPANWRWRASRTVQPVARGERTCAEWSWPWRPRLASDSEYQTSRRSASTIDFALPFACPWRASDCEKSLGAEASSCVPGRCRGAPLFFFFSVRLEVRLRALVKLYCLLDFVLVRSMRCAVRLCRPKLRSDY